MKYYIEKILNTDFESAIDQVTEALKTEGFGVWTEIDLKDKFKEKLGTDFRNYRILGACNPALAYQAIQKEDKIGTMLPCNVVVQDIDDEIIEVAAVDPYVSMQGVENEELAAIAESVRNKLERVISITWQAIQSLA